MSEILEDELDAGAGEGLAIQVLARAAEADEQSVGADRLAKIEYQLALRATRVELGAIRERGVDAECAAQEMQRRLVEIHQALPVRRIQRAQRFGGGSAIGAAQRLEVRRSPVLA